MKKGNYIIFKIQVVRQYIKQIFFGKICCGTCLERMGYVKTASFVYSANYSHWVMACRSRLVAGLVIKTCRIYFLNSLSKGSLEANNPVR